MPCPSDQTTFDFLEHRLSEERAREVREHIDACSECRELVAQTARAVVGGAATIKPGATVGRYVLESELGSGAMGIVWAAHDPELERRVAVKVLHPELADEAARSRMKREARAMARLSHPNVVMVYDVGDVGDGEQVFVAMELVEGETLAKWLATPRTRAEILAKFTDAGRGLAAAHEQGLVHRDFKPENVLVGNDGRARVTDFGLARRSSFAPVLTETEPDGSRMAYAALASLTRTGAFAGTPAYMSPEQLTGMPATARTDQFSFCVALYEALYGERPFTARTFEELVANVLGSRIRPAPAGTSVPPELRRVLLRGLELDPARRHASMGVLLEGCALAASPKRLRGPLLAVTAGVIAVAAALVPLSLRSARLAAAAGEARMTSAEMVVADAIPTAASAVATETATATEPENPIPVVTPTDLPSASPASPAASTAPRPRRAPDRARAHAGPPAPLPSAVLPSTSSTDPYDLRR